MPDLTTSDAGRSWQLVATATVDGSERLGAIPVSGQLEGIAMRPSGVGWLWTDRGIYSTADGGRTWRITAFDHPDASTPIVSAVLVGERAGFVLVRNAASNQAELDRTDDGGRSWTTLASWPLGSP